MIIRIAIAITLLLLMIWSLIKLTKSVMKAQDRFFTEAKLLREEIKNTNDPEVLEDLRATKLKELSKKSFDEQTHAEINNIYNYMKGKFEVLNKQQ